MTESSPSDEGANIAETARIHETAVIDERVVVGHRTRIWHFCHISAGAEIGENCSLGQNVYVGPGVKIGRGVKIQNNVSVYSGVTLEDDVFVGPSVVFTNVKYPRAQVDRSQEFVPTHVRRGASIGANATIVCGVSLGEGCLVGAGAVVTKDVPAYAVVTGNPAEVCGRVDRFGNAVPWDDDGPKAEHLASGEQVRMLDPVSENAKFQQALEQAAVAVLRSGVFIMGDVVARFEAACAERLEVEHAIAVSSGSDALLMSLMAAGVGPGDEVLTTPFSFVAVVEAVLRLGALPRFVDICAENYLIDIDQVLAAITSRTKAFIPVHLFGQAVDLSGVRAEFAARGIPIIEDAAQAFGARGDLGWVGQGGFSTCFSFFPSKNLGGFGDGGLITSRDGKTADKLRHIRAHGAQTKYLHEQLGGNFRLDALQAALLSVKLPHLDEMLSRRRSHVALYRQRLACLDEPALIFPDEARLGHTYNQLVVRSNVRDQLQEYLRAKNIETAVYYPSPLHLQPALGDFRLSPGSLPVVEAMCAQTLAIPIHSGLRTPDIERVSAAISEFFHEWAAGD